MTTQQKRGFRSGAVCIDFDGTIAEFSQGIESFGPVMPGCAEAVDELRRHGFRIIVYTARPSQTEHLRRLAEHLRAAGVEFDEINTNSEAAWASSKPVADLYIDDRALRFEGDWGRTLDAAKRLLGIGGTPPADRAGGHLELRREALRRRHGSHPRDAVHPLARRGVT